MTKKLWSAGHRFCEWEAASCFSTSTSNRRGVINKGEVVCLKCQFDRLKTVAVGCSGVGLSEVNCMKTQGKTTTILVLYTNLRGKWSALEKR